MQTGCSRRKGRDGKGAGKNSKSGRSGQRDNISQPWNLVGSGGLWNTWSWYGFSSSNSAGMLRQEQGQERLAKGPALATFDALPCDEQLTSAVEDSRG